MRATCVLTILYLLAIPSGATAQAWREAYDRREFTKAAALLEALVFDRPSGPNTPQSEMFPNAAATERLATMYLQGVGVPADRVLACSLFHLASRSAMFESDLGEPDPRFDRRREEVCAALSADDREEAHWLMSCVRFGPDLQAFTLGSGHWVQISRKGILVHYRDADHQRDLTPQPLCGQRFTHARHVRVAPKGAGGQERHFLELFSSMLKGDVTPTRRVPGWQLLEIVGDSVHHLAEHELPNELQSMHGTYPPVSFRALASGEVRWRFDGAALAGRVNAPPEEVTQDEFPPIQAGTGRIDVTVLDRIGAPMRGVTVVVSGLVSRTLQTNSTGAATFSDLPDGRYDVVASRKGLPGSLPRVLDISGLAVPVEIVLKPSAPTASMSISCGMAAPRTLEALAAHADAVVHVKVERQRMFRRSQAGSDRGAIMTASETRWIESFKAGSQVTSGAEVLQAGGRLDDGEQIELYDARPHAQLNVGDEYVLFLKRQHDESRSVGIYFQDAGAFRIRNGRVEPLGQDYLASRWRGRSAAKFFEALRTAVRPRASGRG